MPPAYGRLMILTPILLLGFALRVARFTADRFHADEALYAGWALLIPDGDPLLLSVPVDKPPLYLYTLAGSIIAFGRSEAAARLPSLASSTLGIAILYRLGRRLYGPSGDRESGGWFPSCDLWSRGWFPSVGTLAALFFALSPFDILFARTAFTDSMLVLWMLAALWAVSTGRWLLAGIALGLAFATKQHAVFLIPLVVATGWVLSRTPVREGSPDRDPPDVASLRKRIPREATGLLVCALGFALPFAGVVAWDSARWAERPSYWHQSASSYGGLAWAPIAEWGERLVEWAGWARYLSGSRVLGFLVLAGIIALLVHDWRRQPGTRQTWLDTLFVAYGTGYVVAHTVLQFSIWDRYLLPLAPLLALLLGRIFVQISQAARRDLEIAATSVRSTATRMETAATSVGRERMTRGMGVTVAHFLRAFSVSVVTLLFLSAWTAAWNGYPIGGEHWAYQGLDQVAAYLKENAPADAVLYHHWLRWHYSYYLYDTAFELRWWESGEHLRREALRTPDRAQYIVLPDWHTLEPDVEGIALQPVYETRRQDGSVSLTVYRVELQQLASPVHRAERRAK